MGADVSESAHKTAQAIGLEAKPASTLIKEDLQALSDDLKTAFTKATPGHHQQ